jgi:hypothetical protein
VPRFAGSPTCHLPTRDAHRQRRIGRVPEVKFPTLPGQDERTRRVARGGLVGTKPFGRKLFIYFLAFAGVIGYGVLLITATSNGIQQVIGVLLVSAGLLMIWGGVPIIRLHFVKRRDR